MAFFYFLAVILAVTSAPQERRRPPGGGPPPIGGPPPPKGNGTLNGTALNGNGTNGTMGNSSNSGGSQMDTSTLDNTTGLDTMNITSNGIEYYNVLYVNVTTMTRVAIDNGIFTIPAGCYPCIGSHWCANLWQPPTCRSDPGCNFTDQVPGCEDMFPSPSEKIETCEECHANGSDYCIVQNICVESATTACLAKKDHITIDEDFAALGHSMNCEDAAPGYSNDTTDANDSDESKDFNYTLIAVCAAALVLFFCVCGALNYRRKNPATSFDQKMFDTYDHTNMDATNDELVHVGGEADSPPQYYDSPTI